MNEEAADRLVGRTAVDRSGSKIGTVADVYVDDDTGQPTWLAVSTGLFGTKVSFVPLHGAEVDDDDVVVPYDKDLVKDAPRADADGHLEPAEEERLYAHYGTSGTSGWSGDADVDRGADVDVDRKVGGDVSGPETDDAMTRSEEQIDVQTRSRESGRARVRKWIETEDVAFTVPVRREKARLVTEPITDANVDDAMSGGDLTSEEHEVVLSEEVVDVDKRVVPKERVRLETETETDEVAVDETVRKERIELEGDTDLASTRRGDPS